MSPPESAPMEADVEVLPSAPLEATESSHAAKFARIEARRIARALHVPTDDAEVRRGLRARGLPVCYFAEDAHDRRERLRDAMAREGPSAAKTASDLEKRPDSAAPVVEDDYYTEGTGVLKELRMALIRPSLMRAACRLQAERDVRNGNEELAATAREREAKVVESVRASYILSSQVGDDRPLSALSLGPHPSRPGEYLVASGSWGGTVKLWGGANGLSERVQTIDAHTGRISSVSLPREHAGVLLTASADCNAALFRVSEDKDAGFAAVHIFEGHKARVADAKMHPFRASLVATASFDGSINFFDHGRQVLHQETGHSEVYRLCFHPDGGLLTSCGLEGGIRLWDLRSGRAVMTMEKAHADGVLGLDCSGDGRLLASAGKDNVVRVWDLRSKRCSKTIAAHQGLISDIRFAGGMNSSDVLVTGSFDRTVKCWSARRDWGLLKAHTGHEDKVTAVDCTPDCAQIVSACYDKTWKLWGSE